VTGPSGTVLGVDASASAIERARTLLPVTTFPQVRLMHADVNEVTSTLLGIDGAALAFCRLMLLHQADPRATLRQMAALLRPGGVVIAHEASDLPEHAPASEPAVPAMTRVWELVIAAARARGADPRFARQGKAHLESAGLRVESHRAYVVHYPPAVGYEIPRVALGSLRPTLREHALASEDEIDTLDAQLHAAQQSDAVQWVSSPLMFEWIARKPA
jgi:SAM-dependent methyltransferase